MQVQVQPTIRSNISFEQRDITPGLAHIHSNLSRKFTHLGNTRFPNRFKKDPTRHKFTIWFARHTFCKQKPSMAKYLFNKKRTTQTDTKRRPTLNKTAKSPVVSYVTNQTINSLKKPDLIS